MGSAGPTAGTAQGASATAQVGPPPEASAPDERQITDFIRDSFIDLFLSQSRRAQLGLFAASVLLLIIWAGDDAGPLPWLWAGALISVSLWRIARTEVVVRAVDPRHATRRIIALLALNGVLMAGPLLGFGALSEVQRAAVTLLLIALATGAVASTAGHRGIFLAFAVPMMVPLALAWVISSHPAEERVSVIGIALLILVYLGFLLSVARQQHEAFQASCRIRFAEQALNARLRRALDSESEANRAKTQFLAAASHDLRQPIHSMNVLIAALQMRQLDPKAAEMVQLLGQVNQMLSTQLDALLDVSRLDAGAVQAHRSAQRLDLVVAAHHEAMTVGVAAQRGLACRLDIVERVTVHTDPGLLLRVLGNLTDNAVKYNRQGGEVRLQVWREGDRACVSVSDTGVGIPEAEQAMVFREFYQVGNVERDRTRGLGLGLSIVQRLAALLDIEIELASRAGIGTTVTLRMPALATQAEPEPDASVPPPQGNIPGSATPGLRVLVIDDEAQVRRSVSLLLEELGCTVMTADGTAQARELVHRTMPEVVLSDLRLRGGDSGLDALRALRPLCPDAVFALVTGDTAPQRIQQAEQAGVLLLHKPVPVARLHALLADAASRHGRPGPTAPRTVLSRSGDHAGTPGEAQP